MPPIWFFLPLLLRPRNREPEISSSSSALPSMVDDAAEADSVDMRPTPEDYSDVEEPQPRTRRIFSRFPTITSMTTIHRAPKWREWIARTRKTILEDRSRYRSSEYIPNYRTLPIVSGVVIPFSILLGIPGLTEHWYIRTEDNLTIEWQPNPTILDVGLGFSMASALIANIALILRFLEKSPKLATMVAIIGLTIHDIINAIACTIFAVAHRYSDGFTYGQAFWFTLCSTIASLFTTVTLIWDWRTTPDFAKSGSGLTRKQRTLVIVAIILLCYIALGALAFSFLLKLSFQNGLYFTIVSIETIGFGDIVVHGTSARVFAVFYNTFGIINFGFAVLTIRETVVEFFENTIAQRKLAESKPLVEPKTDFFPEDKKCPGLPHHIVRVNKTSWWRIGPWSWWTARPNSFTTDVVFSQRKADMPQAEQDQPSLAVDVMGEFLKDVKSRIDQPHQHAITSQLLGAWITFFVFWLLGSLIFMHTEGWSYGTAIWFAFCTFTTIGYGDLSPESPAGRAIFTVWALVGVAAMTILISVISEAYSSRYRTAVHSKAFVRAVANFKEQNCPPPRNCAVLSQLEESTSGVMAPMRQPQNDVFKELSSIPQDLVRHAHVFHEHVLFLHSHSVHTPSSSLKKLLNEIAESEKLDEQLRTEVLNDVESRKVLFNLSYERAIHNLLGTAEKIAELLANAERPVLCTELDDA
ncbi:hypothetical protein BOTBODRAFT_39792 [Botryobasidium botryosum FD-172 SS1]|uniref:Potassium channel domain-containing protein n=1 Tax=Botryobasidium botryosum (strain FD-172 SS1) TaxID=930990 RepID=A0A067M3I9_BOTB1|nr:hypothetical protein BOTBODRAFT_39792 [Botryobasidium botryosum FD-172 SS1]